MSIQTGWVCLSEMGASWLAQVAGYGWLKCNHHSRADQWTSVSRLYGEHACTVQIAHAENVGKEDLQ